MGIPLDGGSQLVLMRTPSNTWPCPEAFPAVMVGRGVNWIEGVEARGAVQYPKTPGQPL